MRKDLPTGTVTFLFTDIEGSTRLLHSLGADAYAEALAEHRRLLREAFVAHGGVEIDTQGDAFFVAFPTAGGAAAAALAAQEALVDGPISVRMGLHTGAPTVTSGGYIGMDVHRGARVAALAHGEQIILSPATEALLDNRPLRDLGLHRLKDFEGAIRLSQLGDREFPPLRTPGSVDLPVPATRFIGRERELSDAVSLVYERDPRVLTIIGPGGTGKTRFAIELARLLADDADGATVFVPLAPLHDSQLVLQALADRLGASAASPSAIAGALRDRRTHLVADNLEHLLPAAARPIAEIIEAAPSLRILATSREPLRIQGEIELDLPPLVEDEAITLFVERGRAVRPDLEHGAAVTALCQRLDHLPLALELAAARTKLLTPETLLARLGDRLDLLEGTRDADERHQTLRATIGWSHDLLESEERELFARLSVFAAGCSLESAEAVCDADLDTLASLLDKSLLRRRTGRLGEERFWMLETIKEFARERLDAAEPDKTHRRHAERMLEIAESAHLSEDDDEPFQLGVALAESNDLRTALDWSAENDIELAARLAVSLETFWNAHAIEEGRQRLPTIVARRDALEPGLRARVLRVAGNTAFNVDQQTTRVYWDECLALCRALGDDRGAALILHRAALWPLDAGDLNEAREMIDESQRLAAGRSVLVEAVNLWMYAQLAFEDGNLDEAVDLSQRSAEHASRLGWTWWVSGQHVYLARVALRCGDIVSAEREGLAALEISRADENRRRMAGALAALAQAALARGELERAGLLWGCAESEITDDLTEADLEWFAGRLLTETTSPFEAARERGRQFDLWDAAAIALGELESTQTEP
ncbi:MAG: ATP-binding protein [Gaiellaceae bacterium]